MARMNRPAPVEITYKNMRFLITHNPTNATLNKFIEVSVGVQNFRGRHDPLAWTRASGGVRLLLITSVCLCTGAEEVRRDHRRQSLRGHL